jgi:transcriptional regulator with XRE-family HTH domain
MPQRTESGARLFALLEAHGWTDGDSVRLTPLVRQLRARGIAVTRAQLNAALYAGQDPSRALLHALARGLRVTPDALRPPESLEAHRPGVHPLATLEPIDDVRTTRQQKKAKRKARLRSKEKLRVRQ